MKRVVMTLRVFPSRHSMFVVVMLLAALYATARNCGQEPSERGRVTLDFNEVDLPVFIRYISELSGKHFILDERVTGKITMYSPTKVTPAQAYNLFLSALEVRRLAAIPRGDVTQIVQVTEMPPARDVYVFQLKNAGATDTTALSTYIVTQS